MSDWKSFLKSNYLRLDMNQFFCLDYTVYYISIYTNRDGQGLIIIHIYKFLDTSSYLYYNNPMITLL